MVRCREGDGAGGERAEEGEEGKEDAAKEAERLTFAEAVDEIAQATGRTIEYVKISPDVFAAGVGKMSLPEDIAWLLVYLFATVLDGRNAHLVDGVRRALGREPGDFAEYARRTAAAGVWDVPS